MTYPKEFLDMFFRINLSFKSLPAVYLPRSRLIYLNLFISSRNSAIPLHDGLS